MFINRHRGRFIFALMLVGWAANASAEVTNCMAMGRDMLTCYSNDSGGNAGNGAQGSAFKNITDFIARSNEGAIRKRIGKMLATGDCEGAGRYALSKGRLELGTQILQSCQSYVSTTSRPAQSTSIEPVRPVIQPSASYQSTANFGGATIQAFNRGEYAGQPEQIAALAKQGFAPAQNELGTLYQLGKGVPQNNAEAVRFYQLAAAQGMRDAQANLAWMYENGQGVVKNIATAKRYYDLAAKQGDRIAATRLNALMTER